MRSKKILSVVWAEKFNPEESAQYHLLIHIGYGLLKISCIERSTQTCLLLGVYTLPTDQAHHSYIETLERLYNEDFFLLKQNWYSIVLTISNQKFTLLPQLLLSKKDLAAYMHVACGIHPNDEVAVFTHVLAKLSIVFAENAAVLDWFRNRYRDGNFHIVHQVNAMIEGIQLECPSESTEALFIWVEACYLHLAVYRKTKLLYYNIFAYETYNDFVSYLSAVVQMIPLQRSTCKTYVGGLIEKQSPAYRYLKMYMPRTTLKTKINFLSTHRYVFEQSGTKPMLYFDLMSSLLCHTHGR